MDTILVPLPEGPDRWAVEIHPGPTRLGLVERGPGGWWLRAEPGSRLAAAGPGPYGSREAVQSAVQDCLGGACELFPFDRPTQGEPPA